MKIFLTCLNSLAVYSSEIQDDVDDAVDADYEPSFQLSLR